MRLNKKNTAKIFLVIVGEVLTRLPCWNWSSRLVDRLIVASEVET